ncbi:MAG: DUF3343 domain-containing protein [Clostridia bacterium]|nr:DUF3343 domain-containing protein [Clostridia bacterium]
MNSAIITLGSLTYATKARRLFTKNGIDARTVKLSEAADGGCTHGIEIKKSDLYSAVAILREAGVQYSLYRG